MHFASADTFHEEDDAMSKAHTIRGFRLFAGLVGLSALMLGGCASTRVGTTTIRSASLEPAPLMDAREERSITLQALVMSADEATAAEPPAPSDEASATPAD
jgi:hypothetical protein